MRKLFTENRVLAFIQIALAFGAGSIVIAAIHSLSSLPWLYLAAIFCVVTAATAGGLYRLFGAASPALVRESPPPKLTLYDHLVQAKRRGEEIQREIRWANAGRSLAFEYWQIGLRATIANSAPEYLAEAQALMDHYTSGGEEEEKHAAKWLALLDRVMKDPKYR